MIVLALSCLSMSLSHLSHFSLFNNHKKYCSGYFVICGAFCSAFDLLGTLRHLFCIIPNCSPEQLGHFTVFILVTPFTSIIPVSLSICQVWGIAMELFWFVLLLLIWSSLTQMLIVFIYFNNLTSYPLRNDFWSYIFVSIPCISYIFRPFSEIFDTKNFSPNQQFPSRS